MGNVSSSILRYSAKAALRAAIVALPLACLLPSSASACCGGTFTSGEQVSVAGTTVTESVWSSTTQLVSSLQNGANLVPVLSVTIPVVKAGQVISFTADLEAINNYDLIDGFAVNPLFATQVYIDGQIADHAQCSNVTPLGHSVSVTRAGFWQAGTNMTNVVVQLMARSADVMLQPNQQALTLAPGVGALIVKVGY
jgi:hypothetical protein